MSPTRTFLNFGVFIVLVIRLRVDAMMVKYEEPFPPQLPVQVKSRVAFSQYGNVPMLSLEEIKEGFPWLEMSAESETDREATQRSIESEPRYIFYYVPSEVTLQKSGKSGKFYPGHKETEAERQNSLRDKTSNHRFQGEGEKPTLSSKKLTKKPKQISKNKRLVKEKSVNHNSEPLSIKSDDLLEEKQRYGRHRDRDGHDQEEGQSESKIRSTKGPRALPTLPKNHKFRDRDYPVRTKFSNVAGTRSVPSYLYPNIPSPYMQLPKLDFEEKEYWVKNKRKSKRPLEEFVTNEERLKNHRIAKQRKSKKLNPENEERLKNHKPAYDREHDPDERAESSNGQVQRLHRRPKENPKNPLLLSEDGERIEFQIHGHEGPQTYIFGFDTGNGENRHFRLEERLRDGSVKGHYGYYDSNGKLKMVEYKARPMGGYEEIHHNSNAFTSDKENNDETHETEIN